MTYNYGITVGKISSGSIQLNTSNIHKNTIENKIKPSLRSSIRFSIDPRIPGNFDKLWKQYIADEGFVEKYYTDELVNILLIISLLLFLFIMYRVFKPHKINKNN